MSGLVNNLVDRVVDSTRVTRGYSSVSEVLFALSTVLGKDFQLSSQSKQCISALFCNGFRNFSTYPQRRTIEMISSFI